MDRDARRRLLDRANAARLAGGRDAPAEARLGEAHGGLLRLAVYGTLAPGEVNHDQLSECTGTWRSGTVRGWRREREYPELVLDASGPQVAVQVLESPALAEVWPRLDEFEGEGYRRVLVEVRFAGGGTTVANVYAAVTDP
jgi:gamma-glutamylcyclotransferase (GGCT)/AIG2-like uncharacterized protein YtfP